MLPTVKLWRKLILMKAVISKLWWRNSVYEDCFITPIRKKLRSLRNSYRETKKEKLSGYSDIFRIRVGQYRIVYRQKKGEIHIVLIAHRKDIYQLLQRFIG